MSNRNVVDVKAWIDSRSISNRQWLILALGFIVILFDGYNAAVMGFIARRRSKTGACPGLGGGRSFFRQRDR